MPKPGFKSITISESVYDKFHDVYEENKDKLTMKGVNSFAGYITYMLEDKMQKDKTFAKYAPKLELVSIEDDRVIIRNNIQNSVKNLKSDLKRDCIPYYKYDELVLKIEDYKKKIKEKDKLKALA